jgi:hypothetical protein
MRKQFIIIIIISYISYCCGFDRAIQAKYNIEQKALDFLIDSLVNKPIFRKDEINLHPGAFWIEDKLFNNHDLYSDFLIDSLSYPSMDKSFLRFNKEELSDSVFQEAKAFLDFYEKNQFDTEQMDLNKNHKEIEVFSFNAFKRRKRTNEIFIKVYKHIETRNYKMVRIKFYEYLPEKEEFGNFNLLVFFNSENGISHRLFE